MPAALAPSPQPRPVPTGRALPPCLGVALRVLDKNPQLKGRFTSKTLVNGLTPAKGPHRLDRQSRVGGPQCDAQRVEKQSGLVRDMAC